MNGLSQEDKKFIKGQKFPEEKEPLPWENELPEAPASATCKVESPNGFQYLFTLRASSGLDLLTKLLGFETQVLEKGWQPLDQWQKANGKLEKLPSPKCPKCGSEMIKRTSKKTGNEFWGCSKYPDCDGIVDCKK